MNALFLSETGSQQSREIARQLPYFELLMVSLIIMVLAVLQFTSARDAIARARLIESLSTLSGMRTDLIEHLAVFGEGPADRLEGSEQGARTAADAGPVGPVASLSALQSSITVTNRAVSVSRSLVARDDGKSVYGLSEGVPTAALVRPFLDGPRLMELRPAVPEREPAVLVWLCGKQVGWPGLQAPRPREPSVPPHLLPLSCRGAP